MEAYDISIYFCGRQQCTCGHSFGPAIRPHYLIHFILSGKGTYSDGYKTYQLSRGDAFLITPQVTTCYEADKTDPWEYAWVAFDGRGAAELLKSCGLSRNTPVYYGQKQNASDDCNESHLQRMMKLVDVFFGDNQNEYELLGYFYLVFSSMQKIRPQHADTRQNNYFEDACSYIAKNYTYDVRIRDIAKHIGIDRTYLYKIFIEEIGQSPQQYLICHRLKASTKLLKETVMSITEIAYSCGFKDSPSYCKHFRKHYRLSPTQYRRIKERYNG